jgi:putative ABC transport system permease protein
MNEQWSVNVMRMKEVMNSLWQDMRYGARTLMKQPGFTFIALVTIALGIGANTAIFSVVNAVLIKPLPYPDADRLVQVWQTYQPTLPKVGVSGASFQTWREQTQVFSQVSGYRWVSKKLNLTGEGEPVRLQATYATANLFSTLGVTPALGRTFLFEEDQPGPEPVVLLSYDLWQRQFGADQNVIGRTINIDDGAYRVVGVLPAYFRLPDWADVWLPAGLMEDERTAPIYHPFSVIARLKDGVTLSQAEAELETFAQRAQEQFPQTSKGWGVTAYPLKQELVGDIKPALLILFGAVGFVLLIAVANVVNLLLVRAMARQKEIALRIALGATRRRVIQQLLIESLLLSLLGGTIGFLLAFIGVDFLIKSGSANLPQLKAVGVDFQVLGFTFGLMILTGLASGLMPALQATKQNLNACLKDGSRTSTEGPGGLRLRKLLMVSEIALALVLLIGAGLLIKSFANVLGVDPGFQADHLLTMEVSLPQAKDTPDNQGARIFEQIVERVEALPGVESVGGANVLPVSSEQGNKWRFIVEGQPISDTSTLPVAEVRFVSLNYFQTIGIPLIKGRMFTESDWPQPNMVINESLAARYWPDQDPIGKRVNISPFASAPTWATVIGVVGNVKHFGLDTNQTLDMYWPGFWTRYLIVRTGNDPMSLATTVQNEIHSIDASLPISSIMTMDRRLSASVSPRQFSMILLALFSAIALALSAVGTYGVVSYFTAQQTREIGIRIALGAQTRDVWRLVLNQSLRLVFTGLGIGLAASLALTNWLKSLLFGVSASDPSTYVVIALLLLGVALTACFVPARRATKVDPMVALRYE